MGIKCNSKAATGIKLSDIYAVELIDHGLIYFSNLSRATKHLLGHDDVKVCSCSYLCAYIPLVANQVLNELNDVSYKSADVSFYGAWFPKE